MKSFNPVAKHARKFNKAAKFKNKKKLSKLGFKKHMKRELVTNEIE